MDEANELVMADNLLNPAGFETPLSGFDGPLWPWLLSWQSGKHEAVLPCLHPAEDFRDTVSEIRHSPCRDIPLTLVALCQVAQPSEARGAGVLRAGGPTWGLVAATDESTDRDAVYERTLLSKNKAAMLRGGQQTQTDDADSSTEGFKDPFILEFLDLKDEYSERDLEDALIHRREDFLLELGDDFAFIGRQRRLRVGDQWFRMDLVFYHHRLHCLVMIDLKRGEFTHADAGQMHLYRNYAREHWTHPDENPPVEEEALVAALTDGRRQHKGDDGD